MSPYRRERRLAGRHWVKTPLRIRLWKSQIPDAAGESLNVSPRGMYFSTEATLREGETVEVFFDMPREITGEPEREWRCTGHVVRTETIATTVRKLGVGMQFDCYEVSRSKAPEEELSRRRKPVRMMSLVL